MNIISLSTREIARILLKKKKINVTSRTLIHDTDIRKDVLIIHPREYDSYEKKTFDITLLYSLSSINEMRIIEVYPTYLQQYFVRFFDFTVERNGNIKSFVSREETLSFHKILLYANKDKKAYTTFSLPYLSNKNKIVTPLKFPPIFTIDSQYKSFPPNDHPTKLHSIAFVYDPVTTPNSFEEVHNIFNTLKEFFPSFNFNIFSLPLGTLDFDLILQQHTIVHFAGHIDSKGLRLGDSTYYNPLFFSSKLTCLLFLNGCRLETTHFLSFINRDLPTLFYFTENQFDILVNSNELSLFYLGLFLGYRIGDLNILFSNKNMRFFGWAHQRFQI